MIAYGICIGSEEKYQAFARRSLREFAAPDAPIAELRDAHSIFAAYNQILEAFANKPDIDGLVLLHEDVEIQDREFEQKIHNVLSDTTVAIAGVIGALNVTSLAWWEGEGRGRCAETRGIIDFGGWEDDVDAVDGLLLVLSPWAVRSLRFDQEAFCGFHGYDIDICFQARAAGRRVRLVNIDLFHHTKGGYGDIISYQVAEETFKRKWADKIRNTISTSSS
jgi:hypothetical protein